MSAPRIVLALLGPAALAVGVTVAIWTVQLSLSPLWLKHFRMGPLEWVWRSGVYFKLQPLRR